MEHHQKTQRLANRQLSETVKEEEQSTSKRLRKSTEKLLSIDIHKPRLLTESYEKTKHGFSIQITDSIKLYSCAYTTDQYNTDIQEENKDLTLTKHPDAFSFLKAALKQDLEKLPAWVWSNGNNNNNAIQYMRVVLTDYYSNCMKPMKIRLLNERTPSVEYLVPVFKYYSAIFKTLIFEWCEKGLIASKILKVNISCKKEILHKMMLVLVYQTQELLLKQEGISVKLEDEIMRLQMV